MKLRPYQVDAKNQLRNMFEAGKKRVVLCSPTGSGKTVTFADIAYDTVRNGGEVIVVVDRKELLEQAKDKLISYGLMPSVITAGRRGKLGSEAYVATVQTLMRREFPNVTLVIIDEAHKQIFDKIFLREAYKDVFVIASTATPIRSGKMTQLSDIYDDIVQPVTISELIKDGYLVPAITYGAKLDMSGVKEKGGDYDEREMYEVFNKPQLYDGVVEKYKTIAYNTQAICFNVNVKHSKQTCQAFNDHGIPAIHIDGNVSKYDREKIFKGYEDGFFKVLCNVDIATTGYDNWRIETVIPNVATKSLPKWLQMAGRGGRITPPEFKDKRGYLQKTHFNLIDMGGNTYRLGFWEQEREFSLTHKRKDKLDVAPIKECPESKEDVNGKHGCGALIPASYMTCKVCGYVFPVKKTELADAEFLPLDYGEQVPQHLRGRTWGAFSLQELEELRIAKGWQLGWVVKQILSRQDMGVQALKEYAAMRNFNPAWVEKMKQVHKLEEV